MVGKGLDFLMFAYTIIRCCDHGHISESDARLFLQLFYVPRTVTVHTEVYTCIVYARFLEPLTIPSFQLLERPYQACMHNRGGRNWAYICT